MRRQMMWNPVEKRCWNYGLVYGVNLYVRQSGGLVIARRCWKLQLERAICFECHYNTSTAIFANITKVSVMTCPPQTAGVCCCCSHGSGSDAEGLGFTYTGR